MHRATEYLILTALVVMLGWFALHPDRPESQNPNRIVACDKAHTSSWMPHYFTCAGP